MLNISMNIVYSLFYGLLDEFFGFSTPKIFPISIYPVHLAVLRDTHSVHPLSFSYAKKFTYAIIFILDFYIELFFTSKGIYFAFLL